MCSNETEVNVNYGSCNSVALNPVILNSFRSNIADIIEREEIERRTSEQIRLEVTSSVVTDRVPIVVMQKSTKWKDISDVFFGPGYGVTDAIVIAAYFCLLVGSLLFLAGLLMIFENDNIRVFTFETNTQQNFMLIMGASMVATGLLCAFLRVLIFPPRIWPGICPKRFRGKKVDIATMANPAMFSVASSALSAATLVGVRYSQGSSLADASAILKTKHSPIAGPSSQKDFNYVDRHIAFRVTSV